MKIQFLQDFMNKGNIKISATLEYILSKIRDMDLKIEGVTVDWKRNRGSMCSSVALTLYK